MTTLIFGLLSLVTLAWGWDFFHSPSLAPTSPVWLARQELMYISGLLSVALMSLVMFLATRPAWLERPLGGMDRVYRAHKWAGILAVAFAATHWLVEMSSDMLKAWVGREGRPTKERFDGLLEVMRKLGEDLGEWAIYAVLAMLLITLWKKFPYKAWSILHRSMPVLYLMLAFHTVMLMPTDYWRQPVGVLMALLLGAGIYGAVQSLRDSIGQSKQAKGSVVAIGHPAPDISTIHCQLDDRWTGHRPGQFAFVTLDDKEGAHPFTIASADRGDQSISFEIKALGDYTRGLAKRIHVGQSVRVEGPYGRFDVSRCDPNNQQIWIAGGIGVTPFIAWLESFQAQPNTAPVADLHYCTRDQTTDAFVPRLQALCATLPAVKLHIHGSQQGANLNAQALGVTPDAEIWYCGPAGLGNSLRAGLKALGLLPRFHQEAFEMR
ncbi:ferric reductase-like transmembrane domain-containing protein [Rhodoferax sp.]|uniref:ferredoxin reductase family protein n=1 Tax=Rhodoferax sp. TaxID=50421 RepID=UPI00260EDA9C|nr:ferric reductase-like transmembrane domain-containing protein [Rhodoferax sp.]MDD5478824.1 ferric reductase-like transmembrane domain-containing protein [Rhodoferax sp.]